MSGRLRPLWYYLAMQRRTFLSATIASLTASGLAARAVAGSGGQPATSPASAPAKPGYEPRDPAAASKLGWELGTQAWTFRDRTCFEVIDTAKMLGLTCVQLFPGQQLNKDSAELKVGPAMTPEQRTMLKDKLKSSGVRAHSFGVIGPGNDEKDVRGFFEFAKDMGMKGLACEPVIVGNYEDGKPQESWKLLDKLTREYGIYVACHNHPRPSTYWKPEVMLACTRGMNNKLLGACADTGHWVRSELGTVDSLKKYEGRIFELHFKDVKDNADRPWGTGAGDARGQLAELKRQGFKGPIFVEYETGAGTELEMNVAKCVEFFDRTSRELS